MGHAQSSQEKHHRIGAGLLPHIRRPSRKDIADPPSREDVKEEPLDVVKVEVVEDAVKKEIVEEEKVEPAKKEEVKKEEIPIQEKKEEEEVVEDAVKKEIVEEEKVEPAKKEEVKKEEIPIQEKKEEEEVNITAEVSAAQIAENEQRLKEQEKQKELERERIRQKKGDKGVPLRESYWSHPEIPASLSADKHRVAHIDGDKDNDERVLTFECLVCSHRFPTAELYVLENCGHFFCVMCLYSYAQQKLREFRDQKWKMDVEEKERKEKGEEAVGEEERRKRAHVEIACPLAKDLCGIAISKNDLKVGFKTFNSDYFEEHELPQFSDLMSSSLLVNSLRASSDNQLGLSQSLAEEDNLEEGAMDPTELTASLLQFLEENAAFIKCPQEKCGYIFERVENEETPQGITDDSGKPLTKEALEHYSNFRFRCRKCDAIFCSECKLIPYHIGQTCKQFADAKDAKKHCRFCDVALALSHAPYTPPNPDAPAPSPAPAAAAAAPNVEVDPLAETIEISGCDYPNNNGTFVLDGRRNGQPCYTRRPGPGALYFDGQYWKICQAGAGPNEDGWNYSQLPGLFGSLPLGRWEKGKNINWEQERNYSNVMLKAVRKDEVNREPEVAGRVSMWGRAKNELQRRLVNIFQKDEPNEESLVLVRKDEPALPQEGKEEEVKAEVKEEEKAEGKVEGKEEEKEEEKKEEKKEDEPYYVCDEAECKDKALSACAKRHVSCGHLCGGILREEECLPCLHEDCFEASKSSGKYGDLTQEGGDYCNICWVEEISAAPSIHLVCGHIFHYKCVAERIRKKWPGPTISFAFCECPLCNVVMEHPSVKKSIDAIKEFKKIIVDEGVKQLKEEGMLKDADLVNPDSEFYNKPELYALKVFDFYTCFQCQRPYYGGKHECAQGVEADKVDVSKLRCPLCKSSVDGKCPTHGTDFINYKCRFCCEPATWNCGGGLAHYCDPCHSRAGELTDFSGWITRNKAALPKCVPSKCPIGGLHPENGVEFGYCAMCVSANPLGQNFVAPPLKIASGLEEDGKGKEEEVDDRLELTDSEDDGKEEDEIVVDGKEYVRNAGDGFHSNISVSGCDLPNNNGTFVYSGERNGQPYYNRTPGPGCIYFDGTYWKNCQAGVGEGENGWNYSQLPEAGGALPLGTWVVGRNISWEQKRNYDAVMVTPIEVHAKEDALLKVEVSGCDFANDNGSFFLDGERNGQPCFSRRPGPGCIYFDGSYWKISQIGKPADEDGWNYSQLPLFGSKLPLGKWQSARKLPQEVVRNYENVKVVGFFDFAEEGLGGAEVHFDGDIHVSGCDLPNNNGDFYFEGLRNDQPCYSRRPEPGCIYYDGSYWKICQIGKGENEDGWNYSQLPKDEDQSIPHGRWVKGRNIGGEAARNYDRVIVRVKGRGPVEEELGGEKGKEEEEEAVPSYARKIIVSGCDLPNDNGIFVYAGQRNGQPCYSRDPAPGAIYFDGTYWKICQAGNGMEEGGWNYSQVPANAITKELPLGPWVKGKNISWEELRSYDRVRVQAKVKRRGKQNLEWAEQPRVLISEGGKKIRFNEANTTVAVSKQRLPSAGKYYFDILMESSNCQPGGEVYFPEACIVGISDKHMYIGGSSPLLGSTSLSWGFRVDGKKVHNGALTDYAPRWKNLADKEKEVKYSIRVSVDSKTGEVSFSDNGVDRGVAFVIPKDVGVPLFAAASYASSSHNATFI